ncbi:unnamed protein product [Symbiodinium sp. CCMP2592]|nr:unnamed protein product [Symbiodinium sp. CCMP2592]
MGHAGKGKKGKSKDKGKSKGDKGNKGHSSDKGKGKSDSSDKGKGKSDSSDKGKGKSDFSDKGQGKKGEWDYSGSRAGQGPHAPEKRKFRGSRNTPSKWRRVGRHQGEAEADEKVDNLLVLTKQMRARINQLAEDLMVALSQGLLGRQECDTLRKQLADAEECLQETTAAMQKREKELQGKVAQVEGDAQRMAMEMKGKVAQVEGEAQRMVMEMQAGLDQRTHIWSAHAANLSGQLQIATTDLDTVETKLKTVMASRDKDVLEAQAETLEHKGREMALELELERAQKKVKGLERENRALAKARAGSGAAGSSQDICQGLFRGSGLVE